MTSIRSVLITAVCFVAACSTDISEYHPNDPPFVSKTLIGHGEQLPNVAPCPQFNLEFRASQLTTTTGYFDRYVVFGQELVDYSEAHIRDDITNKMVVWVKDVDPRYANECEIHIEFTRKTRPRATDRAQKGRVFFQGVGE